MNASVENRRERAHILDMRHADVEALRPLFKPGARVLEIGGGNGYQASVIASWGCDVESIDIEQGVTAEPRFYSVRVYDGIQIPFPPESFDIVYSCAVLEHVPEPSKLLEETRRVLKRAGMGVHIVPSAVWRFWTIAAHYPHLLGRLLGRKPARSISTNGAGAESVAAPQPQRSLLRRALIVGAHGEYQSAVSELYFFSRYRWTGVFSRAGFDVVSADGNGLFYTGYRLMPSLGSATRHALSKVLGSSCHVFRVQPRP